MRTCCYNGTSVHLGIVMDDNQVRFYSWYCLVCGKYAQGGEDDFYRHREQCQAEFEFEAFENSVTWSE